jgi:hypothetical protein
MFFKKKSLPTRNWLIFKEMRLKKNFQMTSGQNGTNFRGVWDAAAPSGQIVIFHRCPRVASRPWAIAGSPVGAEVGVIHVCPSRF